MRILVTGGAGFIGANLCRRLLSEGHDVMCLDNFWTGRRENIAPLLNDPAFTLIKHDIQAPIDVDTSFIYHLACPASPIHYQAQPIETVKTSFLGTMNLLELAKQRKARMLLASTSEVYGSPTVHPQHEGYWGNVNPVGIRSCYDEGKRVAETLTSDYRRYFGLDTTVVRIFNTYGPYMRSDDGRVVSNFVVQALQNNPLTIHGDGQQTRSFCYVDDLVEALVSISKAPECPGPINLGNPREYTMVELASLVLQATGSQSDIVYHELPEDDPPRRRPDISLARQLLRWEPKVDLVAGLTRTVEYFKTSLQLSVHTGRVGSNC